MMYSKRCRPQTSRLVLALLALALTSSCGRSSGPSGQVLRIAMSEGRGAKISTLKYDGGFLPKTLVYELAEYVNKRAKCELIPRSVLHRPPSAELRADQKDEDSLPPYSVLDPILEAYVEEDRAPEEIAAGGFETDVVNAVVRLVDRNEYKRRQAPPGIKITPKAFGRDRRFPITNWYCNKTPARR